MDNNEKAVKRAQALESDRPGGTSQLYHYYVCGLQKVTSPL